MGKIVTIIEVPEEKRVNIGLFNLTKEVNIWRN